MHGQAGSPALASVLGEEDNELGTSAEPDLDLPVHVIVIEVQVGNRHEQDLARSESGPAAELARIVPVGVPEERVALGQARDVGDGRDQQPHCSADGRPYIFIRVA